LFWGLGKVKSPYTAAFFAHAVDEMNVVDIDRRIIELLKSSVVEVPCSNEIELRTMATLRKMYNDNNNEKSPEYFIYFRQAATDPRIFMNAMFERFERKRLEGGSASGTTREDSMANALLMCGLHLRAGAEIVEPDIVELLNMPVAERFSVVNQTEFSKFAALKIALLGIKASNMTQSDPVMREKSVVFCEWHHQLALLEVMLTQNQISYRRYDGNLSAKQRIRHLADFRSTTKNYDVLLMQRRSGCEGLDLQCANHAFILTPSWNPYVDMQVIALLYPIGAIKTVHIHCYVLTGLKAGGANNEDVQDIASIDQTCMAIRERITPKESFTMRESDLAKILNKVSGSAGEQASSCC
jgi:SNF2 family DNA or RNA helicase